MDASSPSDADAILQQALFDAGQRCSNGSSELDDLAHSFHAITWLQVLAAPQAFSALTRTPTKAHLLEMVDGFLAYVRRGERNTTPTFSPVPYELREERAIELRRLLELWDARALSGEIIDGARSVLEAEGLRPPEGWQSVALPPEGMDDYMFWPGNSEGNEGA